MNANPSLGQTRILIVEDDELDAELVVLAVADAVGEVESLRVENEAELHEALTTETWDIVLSDFNLPSFDAFRSLALVRALAPATPFIVVSGAVGEETAVLLMRAGAADYLMKDNLARLGPAIVREIADAKERRERLGAEHRSQVNFASSPDAMALVDATALTWIEVNPAFRVLTGIQEDEVGGHPFDSARVWSRPEEAVDALDELRHSGKLRDFEFHLRSRGEVDQTAVLSMDHVDLQGAPVTAVDRERSLGTEL